MKQRTQRQREHATAQAPAPAAAVAGPRQVELSATASALNGAPRVRQLAAMPPTVASTSRRNPTGLPDALKAGVESLSGMAMDHVQVHFNSSKPAQLKAQAYAQGSQIYLAPGQERHLPHEAWHVVQQAQGRVRATRQMAGGEGVNEDASLEKEADLKGEQARKAGEHQAGKLGGADPSGHHTEARTSNAIHKDDQETLTESLLLTEIGNFEVLTLQAVTDVTELDNHDWRIYAAVAALVVAWQTFKERVGDPPSSKGRNVEDLMTKLADEGRSLASQPSGQAAYEAMLKRAFSEGFSAMLDPKPMPIARRYASIRSLLFSAQLIGFGIAGERSQLQKAVSVLHGGKPQELSPEVQEWLDKNLANAELDVKISAALGLAAGGAYGSGVSAGLPILSDALSALQVPWDAFHVVNNVAVGYDTMRHRQEASLQATSLQWRKFENYVKTQSNPQKFFQQAWPRVWKIVKVVLK